MDTRSILFLVVMIAIGVVGLVAFLIHLWARQGLPQPVQRGRAPAAPRSGAAVVGPAVLAAVGVAAGVALLIWLLVANAEVFRLDIAWDAGTIVFVVIMLVIAAAGLIGFVIYLAVIAARARAARPAAGEPAEGGAAAAGGAAPAQQAVQTPAPTRLLGLLGLLLAFLILNWSFVELGTRYQLMTWLVYPATLAFALVLLFDKATRTWSYKTKLASFREWLFADLIVFLFVLAYLNLVWSNAGADYNGLLWDVIGILLFVFVFWLMDRKVTRLRFLVVYGYLILLPIGLLIWAYAHDVPTRLGYEQNPPLTQEGIAQLARQAAGRAAVQVAEQAAVEAVETMAEAPPPPAPAREEVEYFPEEEPQEEVEYFPEEEPQEEVEYFPEEEPAEEEVEYFPEEEPAGEDVEYFPEEQQAAAEEDVEYFPEEQGAAAEEDVEYFPEEEQAAGEEEFFPEEDEDFFPEEDEGFFPEEEEEAVEEDFFPEEDGEEPFFPEDEGTAAAVEGEAGGEVQALSWWSSIWPFFFLAIIGFVLEIILLLAVRESDSSVIAMLKDLLFVVLYVVLLIVAIPGAD